jgi:hypothetical protein
LSEAAQICAVVACCRRLSDSFFTSRNAPVLRLSNVRIGTKLAVMSALGILLIAGMIVSQIVASSSIKAVTGRSSASLVKARDLVQVEAAERGMQVAINDIRYADGGGDLQKGGKLLEARHKKIDALLNPMIANSTGPNEPSSKASRV